MLYWQSEERFSRKSDRNLVTNYYKAEENMAANHIYDYLTS